MVSIRCKILVKAALDGLGIRYGAIELGEVELKESLTPEQKVELQKLLKDQTTWPLAIINADKLLDHALKSKRYKGKTMGERLVAAQRDIQGNDDVWFGHKLRNKLVHENGIQLREQEVKNALMVMAASSATSNVNFRSNSKG